MTTVSRPSLLGILALIAITLPVTLFAESRDWTNNEGRTIHGELKSVDEDNAMLLVNGRQFTVSVASLSEADRGFITEWQSKNAASGAVDPAAAYDTPTMKALKNSLVVLDGRRMTKYEIESPEKIEVLAFYTSASWCAPCQAFSPVLARAYKSLKNKYDNFELVLITGDQTEEDMEGYIKEHRMPFPAVKFGDRATSTLSRGRNAPGIPSIHILTRDGEVLDDASRGAEVSLKHLEAILKEHSKDS